MRRQVKKEIVGEDRETFEEISDGGVTNRFGALFTCPIGVRPLCTRLIGFCLAEGVVKRRIFDPFSEFSVPA